MMDHRIDQESLEKTQISWIQMSIKSIHLEPQCLSDTIHPLNSQGSMDSYSAFTAFQPLVQYSRARCIRPVFILIRIVSLKITQLSQDLQSNPALGEFQVLATNITEGCQIIELTLKSYHTQPLSRKGVMKLTKGTRAKMICIIGILGKTSFQVIQEIYRLLQS